jgi:hypothetical protein
MSPSRISDSGTRSTACSELIALQDRPDGSPTSSTQAIVAVVTLSILPPKPPVNESFCAGCSYDGLMARAALHLAARVHNQ